MVKNSTLIEVAVGAIVICMMASIAFKVVQTLPYASILNDKTNFTNIEYKPGMTTTTIDKEMAKTMIVKIVPEIYSLLNTFLVLIIIMISAVVAADISNKRRKWLES